MTRASRGSAADAMPASDITSSIKATAIRQPPAMRLPGASAQSARVRILAHIGANLRRDPRRIGVLLKSRGPPTEKFTIRSRFLIAASEPILGWLAGPQFIAG